MTAKQALEMANGILASIGQEPMSVTLGNGTAKDDLGAVLRAYIARVRKNRPELKDIPDRMIPDMVVQHLLQELDKTE